MTRGRKPSAKILAQRQSDAQLIQELGPKPAHLPDFSKTKLDAFLSSLVKLENELRSISGLSSKTISQEKFLDLWRLFDADDCLDSSEHARLAVAHAQALSQIKEFTKKGGAESPTTRNFDVVLSEAPQVIAALLDGGSYKAAIRSLDAIQNVLQKKGVKRVPSERTLRRWLKDIGH